MLIVCANLSNLLLARTVTRQKEMAIRAALGAGRSRLIRQMVTESMVLSGCGAALGLALAIGGTRLVAHLDSFSIPLLESVRVDGYALAFTLLIALLTGLIFGLVPALQAPALAVHASLKDANRGSSQGRQHTWIRSTLVVSEIAFACVLLVGTGLLVRSFLRVLDVRLGFQPERAAAMRVDPGRGYSTQAKRNDYYAEVLRRVHAVPGVQAAGLADVLPLGGDRSWGVKGKGQVYKRGQLPETFVRVVTDGYLERHGHLVARGRDFTERDTPSTEPVILVNETLARTLWPGQNPIGQIVDQDNGRRVVGVVSDVRHRALELVSGCEMYLPMRQTNDYSSVDLVVRTSLPPAALASAVRAQLNAIDPNLPTNEFRLLQQLGGQGRLTAALRRNSAHRVLCLRADSRLTRHVRRHFVFRRAAAPRNWAFAWPSALLPPACRPASCSTPCASPVSAWHWESPHRGFSPERSAIFSSA